MQKNYQTPTSSHSFEESDQDDQLERNFKKFINKLHFFCKRHTNCTDLVLCGQWAHRFSHVTKQERFARNYLMSLLCNQISNGYLSQPFLDGRNLNPNIPLHNIISIFKYGNRRDEFLKRQSELDSRSFAFRNYCACKESLRQRSLSANILFDRRGNTNTGSFYNYGRYGTYNQPHGQRGQSGNRFFAPNCGSPLHKYSEYGREPLGKHFERSFQRRNESAHRPSNSLPSHLRGCGTRSKSVLTSNEMYGMRQSPLGQNFGTPYNYSTRGYAGGAVAANNLYLHEMDELNKHHRVLSNEYRRMHLQIKQLKGKMQHKSNRLTNDCCDKVPVINNNNNHHVDPDDGAYGGASNYYITNSSANVNTNINVSNNNTSVLATKNRMDMLQKHLINSAHITLDQINEVTSLNAFDTQQELLLTKRSSCKHQLFSNSLAALSYNDESFDEFLRKSDVHVDKLVNAIYQCNTEIRKEFVERELKKLWKVMCENYSKKHKSHMEQHKHAEKLHTDLNELRMLTILKKLFLENCAHKLDHVDKVLNRLDEEFALMGEFLS